ncbi:MAG: DUF116 domain-containing protein [Candidatus Altiarchaeota archaeon]|nr:DUF116 domain-containing protein [Candidatus Altiarchaeota archaeon]
MMHEIYGWLGKFIVYGIWIAAVLVMMSLFFGYVALRRRIVLYSFFAGVLDFFYMPLKTLYARFGNIRELDKIMVKLKNEANRARYKKTKKRILLAPHCMRSLACPASSTREGIQCISCGKCSFTEIKKTAEELGIKLHILTGSSAVRYIIKNGEFDGVLLLACNYELNKVMRYLSPHKTISYGVPLVKDGCFNTEADLKLLDDAMKMGLTDK